MHGFLFDKNSFKEKRIGPILWDSLEKKVLHLGDKSVMQSLFVFTTSRLKSNDNNAIIQTDFQCFDLASTTWGQFEHLFQPLHSHYLILKRFIIRCVSLWKVEGERHFHLTAIFVTCMSSPLFKSLGWWTWTVHDTVTVLFYPHWFWFLGIVVSKFNFFSCWKCASQHTPNIHRG